MRKQWPKRRDTFVVVYETILHVSNIYIVHAWFAYILHTETAYSELYFVSVIRTATTYSIVIALIVRTSMKQNSRYILARVLL